MYVIIDLTTYASLSNLDFAPQTDMTGNSVPVNEMSVDIKTTDDISFGQYVELYDDLDNLYCKYWITYAERGSPEIVQIRASSDIALLDGVMLDAVMYTGEAVTTVLDDTMVAQSGTPGLVRTIDYSLDSSYGSATITGFCPQQTARERLQWVCYVLGAYVKTAFTDEIEILPIDATAALIPVERTYWRPRVIYKDWVTAITIYGYSFTVGTPQAGDKSVTDGTTTWIVTEQAYTLGNPSAPASAPDNVVTVQGVYLVNSSNVSALLTHLSTYYFKRVEVEFAAIDNAEFAPGDMVTMYADADNLFQGFVEQAVFTFGNQAKAAMRITAAESKASATLTVTCLYSGRQVGRQVYRLPVGYQYAIDNLYIDWTFDGHRYILRPMTARVTGTMQSGGNTATVQYAVALDYNIETEILEIISVDGVDVNAENVAVIE